MTMEQQITTDLGGDYYPSRTGYKEAINENANLA